MADKPKRVKLKRITYALQGTPVILKGCGRHGSFTHLCGIGAVVQWFQKNMKIGM